MHARTRTVALPVLLVAALGVSGCGGGGSKEDEAQQKLIKSLPNVKQNGVVDATDTADANLKCAAFQKKKPKLVTQIKFRIPGRPSQPCIIQ
jgi:hypothetical protein